MKIYVLYDNPFDEGWNVYGIFSSQEKLDKAIEVFTPVSNYELLWTFFELDELEKFFEIKKLRIYGGYSPVHSVLNEDNIKNITWNISPNGLDSFLQNEDRKDSLLLTNALWLTVSAVDKEDAIRKGNELLKELINQPEDERGWKWVEK
jgi:hypothetical protein